MYSVRVYDGTPVILGRVGSLPRRFLALDMSSVCPDLNALTNEQRLAFGWEPCVLSGDGVPPEPSALTLEGVTWVGDLVPVEVVPVRQITPREFKYERLTETERDRIYEAAKLSVRVQSMIDDLIMAPYVDLDLQQNIDDINGLETSGLLDYVGRAAVILA